MPDSLRMPLFIPTPPYDHSPLMSSSSSLRSITTDERSLMNIGTGGPSGAALETVERHQALQPLVFVSDWGPSALLAATFQDAEKGGRSVAVCSEDVDGARTPTDPLPIPSTSHSMPVCP